MTNKQQVQEEYVQAILHWSVNPLDFLHDVWGLDPQPIKAEYEHLRDTAGNDEFTADMFHPYVEGRHITWQQWLIFRSYTRALNGTGKKRISVASGHGIGKSTAMAWILLHFLYCHYDAQIPCTAPTAPQLKDILWKEVDRWWRLMPADMKAAYEIVDGFVRIKERKGTWFARGRTSSPDRPEALQGAHGKYILYLVDEATGVHDKVYEVAEGALTDEGAILILFSNYTRTHGYFHDTRTKNRDSWDLMTFDSRESPRVKKGYAEGIASQYGANSDQFRVRVQGLPPRTDKVDDKGYAPIVSKIAYIPEEKFFGIKHIGIDPAGGGKDETIWVLRDMQKMKVVAREKISDSKGIVRKTFVLQDLYDVRDENVYYEAFGVGHDIGKEAMRAGKDFTPVNTGDPVTQPEYLNLRALGYWDFRTWILNGGAFIGDGDFDEVKLIKYTRTLRGQIKIMPKELMKKLFNKSPDVPDAGMITFAGVYKAAYTGDNDDTDVVDDDEELSSIWG